jgi:hypothetical protein
MHTEGVGKLDLVCSVFRKLILPRSVLCIMPLNFPQMGLTGITRFQSQGGRNVKGDLLGLMPPRISLPENDDWKGPLRITIPPGDESGYCKHNPSTGEVDCCYTCCCDTCLCSVAQLHECPEEMFRWRKRKLLRLNKTRPFLTLALSDPGIAAVNNLLDTTGVINRHW